LAAELSRLWKGTWRSLFDVTQPLLELLAERRRREQAPARGAQPFLSGRSGR
jgi:hypothetical protein